MTPQKTKYCTVVFQINDEAAWAVEWGRLWPMFMKDDAPVVVTAVSADHEMDRVALIEETLERYTDPHLIRTTIADIISTGDVSGWKWPTDV